MKELWTNWPNRELGGLSKFYILTQLGFWFQQIFIIHIEERRKDHWQMLSHHFITIALIIGSYRYHLTTVGNLILVLFDIGDILLSVRSTCRLPMNSPLLIAAQTSKCLKYLGFRTAPDYGFGLFMLTWFVARHVLFNMVCWSIYKDIPETIVYGCFKGSQNELEGPFEQPKGWGVYLEPFVKSDGIVCHKKQIIMCFLVLLLVLQAVCIYWFSMIIGVAIRVLKGVGADDVRSDDEGDEDEEEDEFVYEEAQPLEEEVGVEELDLKSWERRTGVKRAASSATGVSLPGHSDRKELLGRIGCEKQVD